MYASILEHLQNFVHDRCIQEMFVEMESFVLFIIIHYNMANNWCSRNSAFLWATPL